jgi:serine/threonine protein kinase
MSDAVREFEGTSRFAITRRIGEGGFGVVYEAFDRERQLTVALKTLQRFNADALYLFKREFRALADLSHPNLVALYELLAEGDQWFFTMELVGGVSFIEWVRAPGPDAATNPTVTTEPRPATLHIATPEAITRDLSNPSGEIDGGFPGEPAEAVGPNVARLREALAQLSTGLLALHEAGKLHCDIKPSNVKVTDEGRVVLLDFGLVAELGSPAPAASSDLPIVGTPSYMSPEQARGAALSDATDWYSVGVMLYEALTGRAPFKGTFVEMQEHKQREELRYPREIVPDLPDDLAMLCRDLLRRDAKLRLNGREILRRLGRDSTKAAVRRAGADANSTRQPLVGRSAHLTAMRAAFAEAQAGRPITLYVHGASGMGKSVLVRHFLDEVQREQAEAVVLMGRCYEQESVPYKALDQLIDGLSQYLTQLPIEEAAALLPDEILALSRLFPVLGRVEAIASAKRDVLEIPDPQEQRRRGFVALRELLVRLAREHPVVLFVDDLQWGDVDSAVLFAELVRPPDPPPLLFIGSYRTDEASTSPALRLLLGLRSSAEWGADVREVIVGGLTPDDTRELVSALLDSPDAAGIDAERIARESSGSPFFINEVVRHFRSAAGVAEAGAIGLDAVIRARVSRLPDPAARLLDVVALAGHPLALEAATAAAGLAPEDFSAVGALRVGRLIRTRDTGDEEEVEPYHDRIRETVVDRLPSDAKRELHGKLAAVLERSGRADAETLAVHFQGSGDVHRAASYATAAAAQANAALAFERAARLYRLALELEPLEGAADRAIRVKLADALTNAGHGAEAAQHYLRAAAGAPPAEFVELQRRASEQLLISGHIEEGLKAVRAALGALGMKLAATPKRALLALLMRRALIRLRGLEFTERAQSEIPAGELLRIDSCWAVAVGLAYVDNIRAADFQARHLLLALRAGEPYRIARALAFEGGYSSTEGSRSTGRTAAILKKSFEVAERVSNPHALALATVTSGIAAALEGRWKQSVELCDRATEILRARCAGVAWELDTCAVTGFNSRVYMGQLLEVATRLPAHFKDAHERGDLYKLHFLLAHTDCFVRLAADEPQVARAQAREGMARWSQKEFQIQHYWGLLTETDASLYENDGKRAWTCINEQWAPMEGSLLLRIQFGLIEAVFARGRSALCYAASAPPSMRESLLKAAERDARTLQRQNVLWGTALGELIHAGAAAVRGQAESAVARFANAEQAFERADMWLFAMSARRRRGQLIGGDEGGRLIAEADEWMRRERILRPELIMRTLAPGG